MIINIIDTEYLSRYGCNTIEKIKKYKKKVFPEIIQLGFIKYNFEKKKIIKKINLFFLPKQRIPKRIKRLTKINEKIIKKRKSDINKIYNIFSYIKSEEIIASNGDDFEIIKMNLKFNKLKSPNKRYYFLNLRNIFNNQNTSTIKKKLNNFKFNLKHDALEDCKTLIIALKIKFNNNSKFKIFVKKNLKIIQI